MFRPNPLYRTDGYKPGHKAMLAPGTTRLYGTWIPRNIKYAPKGVKKIMSFGHQLAWRELHDVFQEYFFKVTVDAAVQFGIDMALYLGMDYDAQHFVDLHNLGYLPIKVKALPEGIETGPNIPHQTFINTVDGFAWLTLFLETPISNLSWKSATSATTSRLYRKQAEEWVAKTDPDNMWLVDYMCHDFSSRGLSGDYDQIAVGLGHAISFRGSDTLMCIPAARYYYGEPNNEVCINSVNASEHSVSTTKIFTVGEQQMLSDWMKIFPKGILSVVADTFDLWKLITEYLPALKEEILSREGKLVIRPDSGDPVDIICGTHQPHFLTVEPGGARDRTNAEVGVIELLWDIFGGTINAQGYKVLNPCIGAIYGDSITPERQVQIYERLAAKGFAATNIVLGVGSFTYQYVTRDTLGFAAKGAWFEVAEDIGEAVGGHDFIVKKSYSIYKDPITDDGTKKSLKGLQAVFQDKDGEYYVKSECTFEEEDQGILQTIYEDGKFPNLITLTQIRKKLNG